MLSLSRRGDESMATSATAQPLEVRNGLQSVQKSLGRLGLVAGLLSGVMAPTYIFAQDEVSEKPGQVIPLRRTEQAESKQDPSKPLFVSRKLSSADVKQDFDIPLKGVTDLYLVVRDGGDGISCDWANWLNVRLVGNGKELPVSEMNWVSASSGFGQVQKNRNAGGRPFSVRGETFEEGIGTHSNSIIHFKILGGYERLVGTVALDDGGLKQGCGSTAVFEVYPDKPGQNFMPGHDPADAIAGLDVTDGIKATLFAAEPDIYSITNIDIDHRGRIWACEVKNYRGNNGSRPEGDRILILEDTDHDGVADTKKVFYQGRDIDSAMGICVIGKHVIVSASPDVFVFTDEDGDDVPDSKDVLFSKTGQPQHDHSAHSFVYGPDGKLYWNFGNTGKAVHDAQGKPVVDVLGHTVVDNGKPYFGGMIFRCEPDGSQFEVLAHNFRNNYETAVDSFGSLWQSDNDDDGNRGVRINYVIEYGNYGYRDQNTGEAWSVARTGMSDKIPQRHWHLNDPGVMPNLLQTGAGSPCAITVYEGRLLPERFWDQVIHCDAGPNIVRAYPVQSEGAGYRARIENIAKGTRDPWFRPVDPCVAPDGSLFVSDWYDPGVGGHGMGDLNRGRIFRFAPEGHSYETPQFDFESPAGAVAALKNPAQSVRAMAHQALQSMGPKARPELESLLKDENPRLAARGLWLLGKGADGRSYVNQVLAGNREELKVVAIRIARQEGWADPEFLSPLAESSSPAIRREVAVALHAQTGEAAADVWVKLAQRYEGGDRWMLESLGLAADGNWDACLKKWLDFVDTKWNSPASRDIIWRSRADATAQWLVKIISQPDTSEEESIRYYRALDFQKEEFRDQALEELLLLE